MPALKLRRILGERVKSGLCKGFVKSPSYLRDMNVLPKSPSHLRDMNVLPKSPSHLRDMNVLPKCTFRHNECIQLAA